MKVVVDASPLIALARIERLELLQKMFGGVVVPSAVWREVVAADSDKTGASHVASPACPPGADPRRRIERNSRRRGRRRYKGGEAQSSLAPRAKLAASRFPSCVEIFTFRRLAEGVFRGTYALRRQRTARDSGDRSQKAKTPNY